MKQALRRQTPSGQDADRWAWKAQRIPGSDGRSGQTVVHLADCDEAPADEPELNVFQALDVLRGPHAVPCEECDADKALGPLL